MRLHSIGRVAIYVICLITTVAIIPMLPEPWRFLNPVLLWIAITAPQGGLSFYGGAFVAGIANDLFSPLPVGSFMLLLPLIGGVLHIIFLRFLTNRSSWSVLVLAGGACISWSTSLLVFHLGVALLTGNVPFIIPVRTAGIMIIELFLLNESVLLVILILKQALARRRRSGVLNRLPGIIIG